MQNILKLEEVGMFVLGIYLFNNLHFAWWWFLLLLLAPDLSALGYAVNNRIGATLYNFFHHKGVEIVVYLTGIYLGKEVIQLTVIILFAHLSMDRIFGYGLKYPEGFKFTHLGNIGGQSQ